MKGITENEGISGNAQWLFDGRVEKFVGHA